MGTNDLSLQAQFQKLWEICCFVTPHSFANGSHFVALDRLQATKTGSKQPRSHFSAKRRLFPNEYRPFTFYVPSQYLFSFLSYRPKSKKISFSLTSVSARPKIWWPLVSSISMPPIFLIANLNCYTPKFSGVAYVDLGPIVWHTAPPKGRKPRFMSA